VGFRLSSIAKGIDKFRPEWVKKAEDKITPEFAKTALRKLGLADDSSLYRDTSGGDGAPAAPVAPVETKKMGSIEESEAQEIVAKRLARMSRYFTSPLGTNTLANTASQKVFS
jgi:hypothetical protein